MQSLLPFYCDYRICASSSKNSPLANVSGVDTYDSMGLELKVSELDQLWMAVPLNGVVRLNLLGFGFV